ncbi:Retrovirus-related Pol polyprotein from transposon opus [Trichinella nativa]|uniref:Retrovirus-related Pol polyprotein from transposon opus n=1 Tax=Trichinella nativa TaxID=6335 RepID=A0A0V1KRY7_9BILA|nr:Retrovirus-related Pol polyprotein from transposon opus [Trichinella nativa]
MELRNPVGMLIAVEEEEYRINRLTASNLVIGTLSFPDVYVTLNSVVNPMQGPRRSLLGKNWFKPLGIRLVGVHSVALTSVQDLIEEYAELFSDTLGTVKRPPVVLHTDGSIPPIQMNAMRVPFALKGRISEELDRLVEVIEVSKFVAIISARRIKLQAHQQLEVDEASAELQTIIAHKGVSKAKRLQFSIVSVRGIFQRFLDSLLANLDDVVPYFKDVLIVSDSQHELLEVLRRVFDRLRDVGIWLNREKCVNVSNSVEFLGYRIDVEGIHLSEGKVEAIYKIPWPKIKQELQAFLGLLNFYHNFLANKAEAAETLHRLEMAQYDNQLPLILTYDASPNRVKCVLAHKLPCDREVPIAFHSLTLATAERAMSKSDNSLLSLLDHKPLLSLLGNSILTPASLSQRMTRWSIPLSSHDYSLVYSPTLKLGNADALSQLPQTGKPNMCSGPLEVLLLEPTPTLPISAEYLAEGTGIDAVLAHVQNWLKSSETIKRLMILFLAAALSICNESRRDGHAVQSGIEILKATMSSTSCITELFSSRKTGALYSPLNGDQRPLFRHEMKK